MVRIAVFAFLLVAACTTARAGEEQKSPTFTERDRAVLGVFRSRIPEVHHLARVHRVAATPELDLVVAFGWSYDSDRTGAGSIPFGAFLQRRDRPSMVYDLSAGSVGNDTDIVVERATSTDLVLAVSYEKGGERAPTEKIVFDPRAKALIRHFQYAPWTMARAFPHGTGAVFLTTGNVAFDFDPARERPFQMLSREAMLQWTNEPAPETFGKKGTFRMAESSPEWSSNESLAVEQTLDGRTKHYWLPQSTLREYRTLVDASYCIGCSDIEGKVGEEKIGGWDIEDGTLWVGKDFYDSEGMTGIGGFGWFDEETRTFRLSSPPEVRGFSITAMQVDKDAIWMTLTHHGEWGDYSSSVARYDRATHAIQTLPLREPGKQFVRVGDSLLLVTENSVVLVSNDSLRSFFVDETSDGRLRVAEALGAER